MQSCTCFLVGVAVTLFLVIEGQRFYPQETGSTRTYNARPRYVDPKPTKTVTPYYRSIPSSGRTFTSRAPTFHGRTTISGRRAEQLVCWIKPAPRCDANAVYRTIDGSCNNLNNPLWGRSLRIIGRRLPPMYNPGSKTDDRQTGVSGRPLPSARKVSTEMHQIATTNDLSKVLTNMHMTWGQFIDHDMTHVPLTPPRKCCDNPGVVQHEDCIPIPVPFDDEWFSRRGSRCMELRRSMAIKPGQCGNEFREQLNNLTSYIDAGSVYGNTDERAKQLRLFRRGFMAESDGRFHLPVEKPGTKCDIPPRNHPDKRCFAAGDKRSNEWGGLTAVHVAFVREHNRIAEVFYRQHRQAYPKMLEIDIDEKVYQETRRIIGALMQVINYKEYLPDVLGAAQMRKWRLNLQYNSRPAAPHRYNPRVNPTSTNVFGTAAFRFGHSQVAFGTQPKASGYINSTHFVTFIELLNQPTSYRQFNNDNLIRGMITEPTLETGRFSPEVRDRLFERTFDGKSLDLPAVSTQRGREHGLPTYNSWRKFCGLPTVSFDHMPDHDDNHRRRLANLYDHPDDIDLFPAAITERRVSFDAQVGPTFACILGTEFQKLKEGDRFWFENQGTYPNSFTDSQIAQLSRMTLSKVLCETTGNTNLVPTNSFRLDSRYARCEDLPGLDLNTWLRLPTSSVYY